MMWSGQNFACGGRVGSGRVRNLAGADRIESQKVEPCAFLGWTTVQLAHMSSF